MQLTSVLPPAYHFVRQHAPVLEQLGAKVEATDSTSVALTFRTPTQAANASALLRDSVLGAKLVVQSEKPSTGQARASVSGIVDLLEGIRHLEVYDMADGNDVEITGVSFDEQVVKTLRAVVDETPLPGVRVFIPVSPA